MKKFKEYNYYDDEIEYSALYLFLEKAKKLIVSALRLIWRGAVSAARKIIAAIDLAIKSRNESKKDNAPLAQRISGAISRIKARLGKITINELALKCTALGLFVVFMLSFVIGFVVKIDSMGDSEEKFNKDAGAVCAKIMSRYGVAKTEKIIDSNGETLNLYRLTGLSFVRQMDFNGDDSPELLICYEDGGIYYVEIWGYDKKDFVQYQSFAANTDENNEDGGSWISLYHYGAKCAIGKSLGNEAGEMELYSLSGGSFKVHTTCVYDSVNDAYIIDGENKSSKFETIKLSHLMPIRAQKTVEATAAHLNEFGTLSIDEIENAKTDDEKRADAYYDIIAKYNQKYGKAKAKTDGELNYIDGLAVVRQLDFNNDGCKELMLVYRYGKKFATEDKNGNMMLGEVPTYYMEIYTWNGKEAKLIYENDGLTSFKDGKDSEVFYILEQDGKSINICQNSYTESESTSRVWKGTSKISAMNEDGRFEPIFIATVNNNYDYMTYTIDGEKVGKKEFAERGYAVPYFCGDKAFDNSRFAVTVLQSSGKKLSGIAADTVNEIKAINDNYHE